MMRFACVVVLALIASSAEAAEQRFAVVIGNNRGAKTERPLRYAERDANTFAHVLRRHGDWAAENTVVLLGESERSIRRALLEVNARIREERAHTTLVVYYSGHASEEGLHLGDRTMSYRELRAIMRGSAATVRLLVLDACRSGGLTNVKGARPAQQFDIRTARAPDVEGMVMISSSAAGEDSHESDRLGASFFSHHFTNALLGAGDEDGDARITLNEAYNYAYRNTLRASGHATSLQHPTYAYDLKGRGDLVMTRLDRAKNDASALELAEPGLYLVLDDAARGDVVAEVRSSREATRLVLPSSRYLVQRRDEDHYREYEVDLAPGETVALKRLASRRVSYARLVRKGSELRSAAHAVYLLGGGRGAVLADMGPGMSGAFEYGLSLELISVGLRLRYGRGPSAAQTPTASVVHEELAFGATASHFFDLPMVSLGVGLLVETIHHQQRISSVVGTDERAAWGFALGALFTAEAPIYGPLVARVEGGPITYVFDRTVVEAGRDRGRETTTPLTGFVNVGVGVQF
ncbi:MAG: caspase family protein [Deltaproteobacteria bacterium]|jgi:hypothetical protein